MTNAEAPYYTYACYLKKRYGQKAYRVAVDGGFSCPNRKPDGTGGCSYCDETGSVAVYQRTDEAGAAASGFHPPEIFSGSRKQHASEYAALEERKASIYQQMGQAREFLEKRYHASLFLLYFQAFSGTNDRPEILKELYDSALSGMDFQELIVSTRPDCIDEEKAALLASYRRNLEDVWVELGLQSARDTVLRRIRRGHSVARFVDAFHLLRSYGIKLSVHVILGLPDGSLEEELETAELIARLEPEGVKIHNLHIPVNTRLYEEYLQGELTAPSTERHLQQTTVFLEHIPDTIVVQRVTADTPAHRLAAPRCFQPKGTFISRLTRSMLESRSCQGAALKETVGGCVS